MNLQLSEFDFIQDDFEKLHDIFNKKINLRKYDKQNYTQLTKLFTKKSIMNEDEIFIRNLAFEYLSKIGLKQNKNYFMIEYWRHRLCFEKVSHTFGKHNDSGGYMDTDVNTCIFYLRKDKTFNY